MEDGSAPEVSEPGADVAQLGSAWLSSVQLGSGRASERRGEAGPGGGRLVQPGSAWLSLAQLGLLPGSIALAPWTPSRRGVAHLGSARLSFAQLGSSVEDGCAPQMCELGADVVQFGSFPIRCFAE